MSGARSRSQSTPLLQRNLTPRLLAPTMPLEGPWSFAKLDWDVRSQMVASAEVADRFEKLAASPATTSDEQLPDVSSELVELAEHLGAQAHRARRQSGVST